MQVTETYHFLFFLNLNIPINCSLNEFQKITINGIHTISPAMTLKLLAIPNIIKHKTKTSVFLYRGLDSKLDEYINSDEDNFVDLGDRPERQNLDGVENTEL